MKTLLRKLISMLPAAQKARLIDAALNHIAEVSYFRLAERGFRPNGIIDIGAYQGEWTRLISKIYPQVPIFMIEAQVAKKAYLDAVCSALPHVNYTLCLLGNKEGSEVLFNLMETGSSVYGELSNAPRSQLRMMLHTLDKVFFDNHSQMKSPLFIKLDVQGSELDVLRGGTDVLELAEVVQIEVPLMSYNEGAPEATDIINFMAERGFAFYDVCGFHKAKFT